MSEIAFDQTLDARGLSCPMPIVRARQAISTLQPGQILQVVASDKGSVKDFQGWAKASGTIRLLAQEQKAVDGQDVYIHYVERIA